MGVSGADTKAEKEKLEGKGGEGVYGQTDGRTDGWMGATTAARATERVKWACMPLRT